MVITSINNDKVKLWSSLKQKKYRDENKMFLIEGNHLVNIALEKNLVVDLISTNNSYENAYIVTDEIMKKISSQVSVSSVAATVKMFDEKITNSNALALDRLQDPGNLGTIIRSAVAFGFENIFLGEGTVDVYNEKTIRASEGMIFSVNFKKINLEKDYEHIKSEGFKVVGTSVIGGESIKKYKEEKICLVIGNEGSGMNKNIKTDSNAYIKMNPSCESLNAAVCASIMMNEVYNG